MTSLKQWFIISVLTTYTIVTTQIRTVALTVTPQFSQTSQYTTTIAANNNPADIYFPDPSDLRTGNYSFPIALLLPGALVDKSFYSEYARQVAQYGFIVVVPNNSRPTSFPGVPTALLAETSQVNAVLAQLTLENSNTTSPIAGVVDPEKLGLLGHSFGAAVGLSVIANQCLALLCREPFTRPPQLLAGAFYGANLRDQITGNPVPINNNGIGVALLQGDRDGVALFPRTEQTYNNIQSPPKLLVSITGANHFGITNVNNPAGALPDPTSPTLNQTIAIRTIARWSALFLRANLLNDPAATDYIFSSGDALDPNARVLDQQTVPEPSALLGLFVFGVVGVSYSASKKNR